MAQRYVYIIARRAFAGPHSRYPYFLYRFTASRRCAKAQAPSRPRDWQRLIPAPFIEATDCFRRGYCIARIGFG